MDKLKIDTVTAFVATDKNGNEGVMGMSTITGMLPMIGADEKRILSLLPIAQRMSALARQPFRIVQFSVRTDITDEVISNYQNYGQGDQT